MTVMTGMYGADVAELRRLAHAFDEASSKLDRERRTVGTAIRVRAWVGPVAVRFRAEWDSDHSVRVASAAARLRDAAIALRRNADDQERTSAADGGTTPSAPAAGESRLARRWEQMSASERAALPTEKLAVYGYSDSIPPRIRDEANRMLLERHISDPSAPDFARKSEAYRQIAATLRAHPDAQLLLLDPDAGRQVHAAISLGDVESADHIGIYTQGWTSRTDKPNGILDPIQEMDDLRTRADASLRSSGGTASSAMVVWMGYDSPQDERGWGDAFGIANAQMRQYGETGSQLLASFADGIRRFNPDAHITGLGHSYGSFVTGLAARETDAFDDMVVFGSPGIGSDRAADLQLHGTLYVLEAPGDVVADAAQFGKDPGHISDARRLSAGEGLGNPFTAHSSYLDDGSLSQRNIADVVSGNRARRG